MSFGGLVWGALVRGIAFGAVLVGAWTVLDLAVVGLIRPQVTWAAFCASVASYAAAWAWERT